MNTILYTTDTSTASGYRTASFDEIIAGAKLALVEIRVLDHCIVAGSDVVSLAELGRL